MHRHLHVVTRPRPERSRPAKVVQLEVRRQARLEAAAQHRPKPAA